MPVNHQYSDDGKLIIVKGEGNISELELMAAHHIIFKDIERFKKIHYWLSDYSAVTHIEISTESLQQLARAAIDSLRLFEHEGRVALVGSKDYIFALMRMWQAFYDDKGWESRVFRSLQEAKDWLFEIA